MPCVTIIVALYYLEVGTFNSHWDEDTSHMIFFRGINPYELKP